MFESLTHQGIESLIQTLMLTKGIRYEFTAIPWRYLTAGGWHFVTVPGDISLEIRRLLKAEEEGWGRLRATVEVGSSEWKTAIWFDTKRNAYVLPLKGEIRRKERLSVGEQVKVIIWV